jgi:hypothetical protein
MSRETLETTTFHVSPAESEIEQFCALPRFENTKTSSFAAEVEMTNDVVLPVLLPRSNEYPADDEVTPTVALATAPEQLTE